MIRNGQSSRNACKLTAYMRIAPCFKHFRSDEFEWEHLHETLAVVMKYIPDIEHIQHVLNEQARAMTNIVSLVCRSLSRAL